MTTSLDAIRADIVARHDQALKEVAAAELCLKTAYAQAGEAEAELRAHDRAVGAMLQAAAPLQVEAAPEPTPAKRQRHDVRGAVRHAFNDDELGGFDAWTEEKVLTALLYPLGIPPAALHSYLLRAVRTGEVERDGKSNRYRLPAHRQPPPEAAPVNPEQQQDAAE